MNLKKIILYITAVLFFLLGGVLLNYFGGYYTLSFITFIALGIAFLVYAIVPQISAERFLYFVGILLLVGSSVEAGLIILGGCFLLSCLLPLAVFVMPGLGISFILFFAARYMHARQEILTREFSVVDKRVPISLLVAGGLIILSGFLNLPRLLQLTPDADILRYINYVLYTLGGLVLLSGVPGLVKNRIIRALSPFSIAAIGTVLTILFVMTYVLYLFYDINKKERAESAISRQESNTVRLSARDPVAISSWNTYRDERFGFEMRYPKGWSVKDFYPSGVSILTPQREEVFTINTVNVGRESVFDIGSRRRGTRIKDIFFAGRKAELYSCPGQNRCPSQLAYSKSIRLVDLPPGWGLNNEIFYDIYKSDTGTYEILENILSTFQFISSQEGVEALLK